MSNEPLSEFSIEFGDSGKFSATYSGDPRFQKQFDQIVRIASKLFSAKAEHIVQVETGEKSPCLTCGDPR